MSSPRTLPLRLALGLYWRSLTLQASWNPQRMQNLGLLFCLLPWLRSRRTDANLKRLFFRRYYGFFNTNPYLANFLIGGLVRLEDDAEAGRDVSPDLIATYRDSLARAFASLGDQLFWLALRPTLGMSVCLFGLAGSHLVVVGLVGAVALALLGMRWWALQAGYARGLDIVAVLGHPRWHWAIAWTKRAGMVLTGALAGVYLVDLSSVEGPVASDAVWLGALLGIGLPLVVRRRLPGEAMILVAGVLALLVRFALWGPGS